MGCQAGLAAPGELVRRGKEARATLQRYHQVSGLGHARTRGQPSKGRQKAPGLTSHMCILSKRVGVARPVDRVGATWAHWRELQGWAKSLCFGTRRLWWHKKDRPP